MKWWHPSKQPKYTGLVSATQIEDSEFYRWHNLEENPLDLPKHEGTVELLLNIDGCGLQQSWCPWICTGRYHISDKEFAVNDLKDATVYIAPLKYTEQMRRKKQWDRLKTYIIAWREINTYGLFDAKGKEDE